MLGRVLVSAAKRAAWLLALLAMPGMLEAQAIDSVSLRGTVVAAETGERLAYAYVRLEPGSARQFASEAGAFLYQGLAPREYRLTVRQVGYVPFDSLVSVGPATPPLRVALRRVAIQLSAINVGPGRCFLPSAIGADESALATVLEQVKINAQRHALLLDQYRFVYTIERELGSVVRGEFVSRFDTLVFRSDARWPYRPGWVVTSEPDFSRIVHYPILADLADSLFQAHHCFRMMGLDTLESRQWVRLDFEADAWLRQPDVSGSAYLDTESYQVRHIRFTVTRVRDVAFNVSAFEAVASFHEILPNLLLVSRLRANTSMLERRGDPALGGVGSFEYQRLLRVHFMSAWDEVQKVPEP